MDQQEFNARQARRSGRASNQPNMKMRLVFGIFMVLFYVALGVLLFTPVFDVLFNGMASGVAWIRYLVAVVLIIYGFFRGYRLWKGVEWVDVDGSDQ